MMPTSVLPAQVMCTLGRYVRIQYRRAVVATTRTAALEPHPFPFFCGACPAGGPGRLAGAALGGGPLGAAAGLAAGAEAGAGAGDGLAAGRDAGGGGVVGVEASAAAAAGAFSDSITLVPPPLATPRASSVGSNTSWTSPKRTMLPGAIGVSALIR